MAKLEYDARSAAPLKAKGHGIEQAGRAPDIMRILLVEDEAALAAQVGASLREAGYAVDHAADGIDGWHLGSEEPYDAVILDTGLPRRTA